MSTVICGNYITDGKKVYTLDSISNGGSGNSGSNDDFQALEKRVKQLEEDFNYAEGSEGNVLKYQVVSNTDGNPKIVEHEDTGFTEFLGQPFENAIEGIEVITQRFKQFNKDFCNSLINYIKTQKKVPWFDEEKDENGEITYRFNRDSFAECVYLAGERGSLIAQYTTINTNTFTTDTSNAMTFSNLWDLLDYLTTGLRESSRSIASAISNLSTTIPNLQNNSNLYDEVKRLKYDIQNIIGYTDTFGTVVEGTIDKKIREELDKFSKNSNFDLSLIKNELYGQNNNGLISDIKNLMTNVEDGISLGEEIKANVSFSGKTACITCPKTYTFTNVVDAVKTIIEWLKKLTEQSTENARFMHEHKDFIVKVLNIKPSCAYGKDYVSNTILDIEKSINQIECKIEKLEKEDWGGHGHVHSNIDEKLNKIKEWVDAAVDKQNDHMMDFITILEGLFGSSFTKKSNEYWKDEFGKRNNGKGFLFKMYDELYGKQGIEGASIGYLDKLLELLNEIYGKRDFNVITGENGEFDSIEALKQKGLKDYILGGSGKTKENDQIIEWKEPGLMNTVEELRKIDEEVRKIIEGYDYEGEYTPQSEMLGIVGGYTSTIRPIGFIPEGPTRNSTDNGGSDLIIINPDNGSGMTPSSPIIDNGNKVTIHNMGINDYIFGTNEIAFLTLKEGENVFEGKYLGLVPTMENIYKTLYGSNASMSDTGEVNVTDYTSSWFGKDGLFETVHKSFGRIVELEKITFGEKLSTEKVDYVDNGETTQVELREAGLKDFVFGGEGYKRINEKVEKWNVTGALDKIDFLSTVLFNCEYDELTTQQIEKLEYDYSTDLGFLQYVENKLGGLYTTINGKIEKHPSKETDENGNQIMIATREPGMYDYIFGGEGQEVVDDKLKSWAKIGLIEKIEGTTILGGPAVVMSTRELPKAPLTHLIRGTEITIEPSAHILGVEDYLYGYKNTEELNLYDYMGNKINGEYKGLIEKVDTGNKKLYEVLDCIEHVVITEEKNEETGETIEKKDVTYQPGIYPYLYGFTKESGSILWYDGTKDKVEEKIEYKGLLKMTDELTNKMEETDDLLKGKTYMGPVEGEENEVEIYKPGILDYLYGFETDKPIYREIDKEVYNQKPNYKYEGLIVSVQAAKEKIEEYENYFFEEYSLFIPKVDENGIVLKDKETNLDQTIEKQSISRIKKMEEMVKDVYGYDTYDIVYKTDDATGSEVEDYKKINHHLGINEKLNIFENTELEYEVRDKSNKESVTLKLDNDFNKNYQTFVDSISNDIQINYQEITSLDNFITKGYTQIKTTTTTNENGEVIETQVEEKFDGLLTQADKLNKEMFSQSTQPYPYYDEFGESLGIDTTNILPALTILKQILYNELFGLNKRIDIYKREEDDYSKFVTDEETGDKVIESSFLYHYPGLLDYLKKGYEKVVETEIEDSKGNKRKQFNTERIPSLLDRMDTVEKSLYSSTEMMMMMLRPGEREEPVEVFKPGIVDYIRGFKKENQFVLFDGYSNPVYDVEIIIHPYVKIHNMVTSMYTNMYPSVKSYTIYTEDDIAIKDENGIEMRHLVIKDTLPTQVEKLYELIYGTNEYIRKYVRDPNDDNIIVTNPYTGEKILEEEITTIHDRGLKEKIDAFETLTINYQTMDESNTYECCFNLANDIFIEEAQQIFNSISSDIKKNYDDINTIDKELNGFTDTEGKYTKGLIEQTKRCLDTLFETEEEREMDIDGVPTMVKVYKPGLIDFITGFEYENGYIDIFGQTVLVKEKISLESPMEFQNDIKKLLYESQTLDYPVYDEDGNLIDGTVKAVVKQPLLHEHTKMYNDIYGTDKYIAIYQKDGLSGVPEQDETGQYTILRYELQHTKGILEKIQTLEKSSFYYESSGGSIKTPCTFNLSNDESFNESLQNVFDTINTDIKSRVGEIKALDNELKEQFTYQDVNYNGVIPVLIDLNKKLYGYTDVEQVENENGEIIERPKQVTGIIESLGKLQTNDNTTTPKINALEKKVDGYDIERTIPRTVNEPPPTPIVHVMGINDYLHGTSEFKNLAESEQSERCDYATYKGLVPTTNELVQQIYGTDKSMMLLEGGNDRLLDTSKQCLMKRVAELENDLAVVTQKFNTLIEKLGGIVDGLDDNYKVPEDEVYDMEVVEPDDMEGGE